jgi:hypothetical protein
MKCKKCHGETILTTSELPDADGLNRECKNCGALYFAFISHAEYIEDTDSPE